MCVCVCWIGFSLDADATRQRQRLAAIHDDYSGSYLTCIFLQFNFIVVCNSVKTCFIIIFGLLLSFVSTLYACAATLCRNHKLSPNRSIEYYYYYFLACLLVGRRCADRMCNNMVFTFSSYPFYYVFTAVVCSFEAIFQYWFAINGESNAHYWDGANKSSQNSTLKLILNYWMYYYVLGAQWRHQRHVAMIRCSFSRFRSLSLSI